MRRMVKIHQTPFGLLPDQNQSDRTPSLRRTPIELHNMQRAGQWLKFSTIYRVSSIYRENQMKLTWRTNYQMVGLFLISARTTPSGAKSGWGNKTHSWSFQHQHRPVHSWGVQDSKNQLNFKLRKEKPVVMTKWPKSFETMRPGSIRDGHLY